MKCSKTTEWNNNQKLLRTYIGKEDMFNTAIDMCLNQHSMVHMSAVSNNKQVTIEDELWNNITEEIFRGFVNYDHGTIARNMWHTTRIEDITMNLLVAEDQQVFKTDNWQERLNITIQDTGNAMTNKEVIEFSSNVDMSELIKYRTEVGKKSQQIIKSLTYTSLKQKIKPSGLKVIIDQGAVLNVDGANWLIDFWAKKNIAGILLMPATRHNMVHINQSKRIKNRLIKKQRDL